MLRQLLLVIGLVALATATQTEVDIHKLMIYGASSKALSITADILQGNVKTGSGTKSSSGQYYEDLSVDVQKLIDEYLKVVNDETVMDRLHAEFVKLYDKHYPSGPIKEYARGLLKERVKLVLENNLKALFGKSTYLLKIHAGSDKPFDEIMKEPAGNWPRVAQYYEHIANDSSYAQHSFIFDTYRVNHQVGKVVNQGGCGACVYFAAAATIESFWARKGHPLVTLSTQQLNDCAHAPDRGNNGCQQGGGTFVPTFEYIQRMGLTSWDNYPYIEKDAECDHKKEQQTVAKIQAWHPVLPHGDEEAMRKALEQHGPLAVALNFNEGLAHFKGGVFGGDCAGGINHAVLLVGYGYDAGTNSDYWLLKNQWGEGYGEAGYFRLKRNNNNMCMIATDVVYVE